MKKIFALALIVFTLHTSAVLTFAADLSITENGSNSANSIAVDQASNVTVTQNNDATIENTVSQDTNTGDNTASQNNGSVTIETGDIKVETTVENTGNTSTVNGTCCPANSETEIEIVGNGESSTNTAKIDNTHSTTIQIENTAKITNNISGYVNTGNNKAENNNGKVSIQTGDISVEEKIINSNINNARVVYTVDSSGKVMIKIKENGESSVNTVNYFDNSTEQTQINNHASILNISNWFANTGKNKAKGNIGDVMIQTGNVYISSKVATFNTNTSSSDSFCCSDNPDYPGTGGENPDDHQNNPANPSNGNGINGGTSGGNGGGSNGGNSGGGSVLGLASGDLLPATGSFWTMWLTILAGILFLSGLYLRLNLGRAPNEALLSF